MDTNEREFKEKPISRPQRSLGGHCDRMVMINDGRPVSGRGVCLELSREIAFIGLVATNMIEVSTRE
jgi:hypothetical protein